MVRPLSSLEPPGVAKAEWGNRTDRGKVLSLGREGGRVVDIIGVPIYLSSVIGGAKTRLSYDAVWQLLSTLRACQPIHLWRGGRVAEGA